MSEATIEWSGKAEDYEVVRRDRTHNVIRISNPDNEGDRYVGYDDTDDAYGWRAEFFSYDGRSFDSDAIVRRREPTVKLGSGETVRAGDIVRTSGGFWRADRNQSQFFGCYWCGASWDRHTYTVGSRDRFGSDEHLATAADLAPTSIPLEDIKQPLRDEVAKLREAAKPRVKPWTFETFPGTTCKVRQIGNGKPYVACARPNVVTVYHDTGIVASYTYADFANQYTCLDGSACGD